METGRIFDIERFATKDGPGIRTVVFFKGCNMRCVWCHNPEGVHPEPELVVNPDACIACGRCVKACPAGAHAITGGTHAFDGNRCTQCLACTQVCFSGALRAVGRRMTVDEVMREVEQDLPIYRKSGGGVTLSGGEVLLQAEFAGALLARCKESGISTAIETNLCVPWPQYEALLPLVDTVFADVKHENSELHRAWTGVGNDLILENLERLKESGKPFAIRTPVIPGFNDRAETILAIVRRLSDAKGLLYYELLTYNPLGRSKGTPVHPPEIRTFAVPERKRMQELAAAAASSVRTRLDGSGI